MSLENLIHMISWEDFWEPTTIKQKCIKWGTIAMAILLGISIFLLQLENLQAYEYACENPVIVEGKRNIVTTDGTHYDIYVSYCYGGVEYEDVYYSTSRSPDIRWDGIETLTVAVDPNNPGIPICNMFNTAPVILAVVVWSLGLSMLTYGIALEFFTFREWRTRQANRPGFLSRPYGKPTKHTEYPDYAKDFTLIFAPIVLLSFIILGFYFPNTF